MKVLNLIALAALMVSSSAWAVGEPRTSEKIMCDTSAYEIGPQGEILNPSIVVRGGKHKFKNHKTKLSIAIVPYPGSKTRAARFSFVMGRKLKRFKSNEKSESLFSVQTRLGVTPLSSLPVGGYIEKVYGLTKVTGANEQTLFHEEYRPTSEFADVNQKFPYFLTLDWKISPKEGLVHKSVVGVLTSSQRLNLKDPVNIKLRCFARGI